MGVDLCMAATTRCNLCTLNSQLLRISPQMWDFKKAPLNRCIAATRMNTGCFRERFRNAKRYTFGISALGDIWLLAWEERHYGQLHERMTTRVKVFAEDSNFRSFAPAQDFASRLGRRDNGSSSEAHFNKTSRMLQHLGVNSLNLCSSVETPERPFRAALKSKLNRAL
jgi:hypothetical protein